MGYGPKSRKRSDRTEQLSTHPPRRLTPEAAAGGRQETGQRRGGHCKAKIPPAGQRPFHPPAHLSQCVLRLRMSGTGHWPGPGKARSGPHSSCLSALLGPHSVPSPPLSSCKKLESLSAISGRIPFSRVSVWCLISPSGPFPCLLVQPTWLCLANRGQFCLKERASVTDRLAGPQNISHLPSELLSPPTPPLPTLLVITCLSPRSSPDTS